MCELPDEAWTECTCLHVFVHISMCVRAYTNVSACAMCMLISVTAHPASSGGWVGILRWVVRL